MRRRLVIISCHDKSCPAVMKYLVTSCHAHMRRYVVSSCHSWHALSCFSMPTPGRTKSCDVTPHHVVLSRHVISYLTSSYSRLMIRHAMCLCHKVSSCDVTSRHDISYHVMLSRHVMSRHVMS